MRMRRPEVAEATVPSETDDPSGQPPLAELLGRAKKGDTAAFEELMMLYERRVYSIALRFLGRREDAQDAAQEVFIRLYKHLRRFREDREFLPWLYRVTVNVCRDLGRKRRSGSLRPLEEAGEPESASADPQTEASRAQQSRIVREAIRRLPEKERAALVLRDLEGLPTVEVARILGSSETTVRSQISAARLKIRKLTESFRRGRP